MEVLFSFLSFFDKNVTVSEFSISLKYSDYSLIIWTRCFADSSAVFILC